MSPYFKSLIRSIKGSFARFVAIFAIIALGVGFYGGLLLTEPSFIKTGDVFVREQKLYDVRLISTIGFTDEDIEKLSALDDVKVAAGSVFSDVVIMDLEGDSGSVARFHSITEGVNVCSLKAGRMPSSPNEVVVDGYKFGEDVIGKKLILSSDNEEDILDEFNYSEYTVVGVVYSPYYLNFQRGSSSVGSGQISYYVYVPLDGLEHEYYKEAFLFYDTEYYIYSDEYSSWADSKKDELEPLVLAMEQERFDDVIDDAKVELDDAWDEINSEAESGRQELIDARDKLSDARQELLDAKAELQDAEKEITDGQSDISSAQREIDSNLATLKQKEAELNDGQAQLDSSKEEAQAMHDSLCAQLAEVNAKEEELNSSLAQINYGIDTVTAALENGIEIPDMPSLEELMVQKAYVEEGLNQVQAGKAALTDGISKAQEGLNQIDAMQKEIDSGRAQIAEGYERINAAQAELNKARGELTDGQEKYDDGLVSYEEGLLEYYDGVKEYKDGYRTYVLEVSKAKKEFFDALCDYNSSRDQDIEVYALGRDTNIGYMSLDNDAQIVAGIARVFPLFFFALAALVCSTTMQRMVGDERTQIGTMRALGYSEFAIIMKYVTYSGLASVLGCLIGFFVGIRVFPFVIWQVYNIMYGFSPIVYKTDLLIFMLALLVSLLCSVGVTVFTALSEMKGTPAELIRPKAPSAGKRILLERINFLWKPLKFTYKVSIRNVFRFKKRMFMMIVGIAGCTALLITGFGIRDSVGDIVDIHYDKVLTYDVAVTFKDDVTEDQMREIASQADAKAGTSSINVIARHENVTHNGEAIRDVNLIISDDENMSSAFGAWIGDEKMPWPSDGQICISSKLARKNDIKAGDEITLSYGDSGESFTLEVAYVFDNYIYHYAYMNSATYEKAFGREYEPDTMYVILDEGSDVYTYAQNFSDEDSIKTWTVVKDMQAGFRETISQLDKVVVLVIACAALLAFIVLFNLNNINITERIREIATLKVLGFNRLETGSYVFRENVILVVIGFILGIPLGTVLHAFVISQIEMDMVTFVIQIFPISYVYSLGFVILFSVIVDFVMRGKIEKINMAESLKSIE